MRIRSLKMALGRLLMPFHPDPTSLAVDIKLSRFNAAVSNHNRTPSAKNKRQLALAETELNRAIVINRLTKPPKPN